MKKIVDAIGKSGLTLMLAGMIVTIVSLVILIQYKFAPGPEKKVAIAAACAGIGLYLVGRIGLIMDRRKERRGGNGRNGPPEEFNLEDTLK
jgi:uncharacterized membrane protein YqjE